MADWQDNNDQEEVISELLNKLEIYKPTISEMLEEIAQSGVSIKLENADPKYFESHKDEVITYMWKVVRVAKILKGRHKDFKFNFEEPRFVKDKTVN